MTHYMGSTRDIIKGTQLPCRFSMLPPPLHLNPSRWIILWLVAIHALAAAAVAVSSVGWLLRLVLVLMGLGSLVFAVRRELQRRGEEFLPVTLTKWRIRSINGSEKVELTDARVFRPIVLLCFRSQRRQRWVAVARDAVSGDVHRRLRAALTVMQVGRERS